MFNYFLYFLCMPNALPRIVMFDLEDTLIESEDKPFIHKWDIIDNIIKNTNPDRIGLFSFILHTQEDVINASRLIEMIESAWNIAIDRSLIPTKRDIHQLVKTRGKERFLVREHMDFMDFCEFWSKDRAFIDWCRITQSGHVILVDDMVSDCDLQFPECRIQMIRV